VYASHCYWEMATKKLAAATAAHEVNASKTPFDDSRDQHAAYKQVGYLQQLRKQRGTPLKC